MRADRTDPAMKGPTLVPLSHLVDIHLDDDFRALTRHLGMDPNTAAEEALRTWMTHAAVRTSCPLYGFAPTSTGDTP